MILIKQFSDSKLSTTYHPTNNQIKLIKISKLNQNTEINSQKTHAKTFNIGDLGIILVW
ncbi:hypothetical protein HMPREF0454_04934 [Hafnia alvei ATCC 51873]|uniref:Uncharacterized protein n=1 Tax=Hafnia alvei ATCC 51873 TaxID=1002364 RepID=G9YE85_HAFAL|nr:hypothetical protein HMPREF0454_04934 [Hafnia alvei ATCC 51873]